MNEPVVIVGAGPVGLTAAVALAQRGIACRIIDKAAERVRQSRAAIIHSRSMEMLERLGLAPAFLEAGIRVFGAAIFDHHNRLLTRIQLDDQPTAFPFFVGLEQTETERILTEALAHLGVTIERPCELTALTQSSDGVAATLRHGDGRVETLTTPFLLGCDGGKSTTRHLLGLSMEGETLDTPFLTADVRIDWDHPPDLAVTFLSPHGFAFITAINDQRWRIVANAHGFSVDRPEDATLERVQELCNQRLGIAARLHDPVWIAPFTVNTRMTPTIQVGRVFLAGDAAHVHSPIGGQGMNTGIQDAFNLAWKLAVVLKGPGTSALLESYQAERHANTKRLLSFVGPATKAANFRHPVPLALRNTAFQMLSLLGLTGRVARKISELDVHYRDSPIVGEHHQNLSDWLHASVRHEPHPSLLDCYDFGRGPHPGERAPDPHGLVFRAGEPQRLYENWIGEARHTLLVFTGLKPKVERVARLREFVAQVEQRYGEWVRPCLIAPPGVADAPVDDTNGEAHHVYGARYECLYLIRPDSYVGFRAQPVELAPLTEHLQRILSV